VLEKIKAFYATHGKKAVALTVIAGFFLLAIINEAFISK
jgi:hypothetical protein